MPTATKGGQHAGFISRLFAFLIDIVVLSIALTILIWFATAIDNAFNVSQYVSAIISVELSIALYSLIITCMVYGYFLFFWVLIGQTPGKTVIGLRVVTVDGSRVSIWRGILRLIGYLISSIPLYAGFLWILVDDDRKGWHDKIAGTHVIYTWEARPDENFLKDMFLRY
jgi:uncharacterized RDD family membrane protein YckC